MLASISERVFVPGDPLTRVGVLVACEGGEGPLRGLRVQVQGEALTRGLVEVSRARARPWSARLAPWEAARWEHALEPMGDGAVLMGTLPGAQVRAADGEEGPVLEARGLRRALGHAVWVELEGRARTPGSGALELSVTPLDALGDEVRTVLAVRVQGERSRELWSLSLTWPGPLEGCAAPVRAALEGFARTVATLPRGERVAVARGTAAERLFLRAGCVVLARRGIAGDARWRELARRLRAGALEQLVLAPPGASPRAEETLEALVTAPARFAPGPVTLTLRLGRALVPAARRETVCTRLLTLARRAAPAHACLREHDWHPPLPGPLDASATVLWQQGEALSGASAPAPAPPRAR